jgi:hypothetical protein
MHKRGNTVFPTEHAHSWPFMAAVDIKFPDLV